MFTKEMMRTIEWEYNRVRETGELTITPSIKTLHFNKSSALDKYAKRAIANKVNGLMKKYRSMKLICDAKKHLSENEERLTDSNISKHSGLSLKTVKRNKDLSREEIAVQILALNDRGGVLNSQILSQTTNEYKPIGEQLQGGNEALNAKHKSA